MRLRGAAVDAYVGQLAELLERFGVVLQRPAPGEPIEVLEAADGSLSFELVGALPDGRQPVLATLEVREEFRALDSGLFERSRYEFEIVDRERDFRRAFHLHSAEWFQGRHLVLVHEHCERPIGRARCDHFEGRPIRDGFAGIVTLMDAWTGDQPDCDTLRCLD